MIMLIINNNNNNNSNNKGDLKDFEFDIHSKEKVL
jgi:hypothetical protein